MPTTWNVRCPDVRQKLFYQNGCARQADSIVVVSIVAGSSPGEEAEEATGAPLGLQGRPTDDGPQAKPEQCGKEAPLGPQDKYKTGEEPLGRRDAHESEEEPLGRQGEHSKCKAREEEPLGLRDAQAREEGPLGRREEHDSCEEEPLGRQESHRGGGPRGRHGQGVADSFWQTRGLLLPMPTLPRQLEMGSSPPQEVDAVRKLWMCGVGGSASLPLRQRAGGATNDDQHAVMAPGGQCTGAVVPGARGEQGPARLGRAGLGEVRAGGSGKLEALDARSCKHKKRPEWRTATESNRKQTNSTTGSFFN